MLLTKTSSTTYDCCRCILILTISTLAFVTATPTLAGTKSVESVGKLPTDLIDQKVTEIFENKAQSTLTTELQGATAYEPLPDADFDFYVPYRSDEHDQFSWRLLKQVLREDSKHNVIFSPFSVKLVLALLAEAAGNNTKTQHELMATLTDIKSPDNIRGFYKKILNSLKMPTAYHTLNLETKLYTDEFVEPQQRYSALLYTFYNTNIERLRFADPRAAADQINSWSENVTHGKLNQLVTEDSVKDKVLIMANVIYFNALWRREFNFTYDGVFHAQGPAQTTKNNPTVALTEQRKVSFMEITEYFFYYESSQLDAKIIRLPYKGKKFSMFVVLPKAKGGLNDLIRSLENDQLKRMQWMMEEVKVKVVMPKFKFDYKKELRETLNELGVTEIFTERASLPGLARGTDVAQKLKLSNIFQKAGIEVNERGTEVWAATVVEIENKFGGNTIEEFLVDRPFLFFIEEESTGNIIFAGKVIDPLL